MINVSVIIPVLNDLQAIKLTLERLNKQTFPRNRFEIIIIDNGSTDGTWEWLSQQSNIVLLRETNYPRSPYSARNRGIEKAKGEIIVLLDATCVPTFDWVEKGFRFLQNNPDDLFGGNVIPNFTEKITAAQIFDSFLHFKMDQFIKENHVAITANLWVRKYLFEQIGLFNEGVRAGEDIVWTSKCTHQGYRLGYCADCLTHKFTRNTWQLFEKQFRTGKGGLRTWQARGIYHKNLKQLYKKILPPRWGYIKKIMQKYNTIQYTPALIAKLYIVTYVARICSFGGNICGLLHVWLQNKKQRVKEHG